MYNLYNSFRLTRSQGNCGKDKIVYDNIVPWKKSNEKKEKKT